VHNTLLVEKKLPSVLSDAAGTSWFLAILSASIWGTDVVAPVCGQFMHFVEEDIKM
jgi:hypothetical protein